MTTKPSTPRQTRTPAQRAQEALGVAQRKVDRLKAERAKHQSALNRVVAELDAAEKRLTYAEANPDLPKQATVKAADDEWAEANA